MSLSTLNVTVYPTVYARLNPTKFSLYEFLFEPYRIYRTLGIDTKIAEEIITITDKEERNYKKRNLPAADLSEAGVLSIDIDGIAGTPVFLEVLNKLTKLPHCWVVKKSVSGNIVAFFRYKCKPEDFKHIYYKLFLELTLLLKIPIDYLPEVNRLRYVSLGWPLHWNSIAEELTEVIPTLIPPTFGGTKLKTKQKGTRRVWKSN